MARFEFIPSDLSLILKGFESYIFAYFWFESVILKLNFSICFSYASFPEDSSELYVTLLRLF